MLDTDFESGLVDWLIETRERLPGMRRWELSNTKESGEKKKKKKMKCWLHALLQLK